MVSDGIWGVQSHGILVAQFSKTLTEKLKEQENSSVDDIATGASPSPVYSPITAVGFGVIYEGGDPAGTQLWEDCSQGQLSWNICQKLQVITCQ